MQLPKVTIPDRFEALERLPNVGELRSMVVPVAAGLDHLDALYDDMVSAMRGSFLILLGEPGSGKTTLLHTVRLFRDGVKTDSIDQGESIPDALDQLSAYEGLMRIVVIKGREELGNTPAADLQEALLAVNRFIRSREGANTIVAWPCSSEAMAQMLAAQARRIGGDALLGIAGGPFRYAGPPKEQYLTIARKTIEALNAGASLGSLGLPEARAETLAREAATIGSFMQALRNEARQNLSALRSKLPSKDWFQLWIVVVAGNDPENDVGNLTRGANYLADVDRLLSATDANVAQDLKRYPSKIALLGASLDTRIIYLPFLTATALVREYADEDLRKRLEAAGVPMRKDPKAMQKLVESQLARALRGEAQRPRQPGRPPGSERQEEFERLTQFASKDDGALNRTIGEALRQAGLINMVEAEATIEGHQIRTSDLLCATALGPVRLEFMWRARTGVAEIASYVLTKLYQYGKAIGFLNGAQG